MNLIKIKVKKRLGKTYPYYYTHNCLDKGKWRYARTYYFGFFLIAIFLIKND